MVDNSMTFLIFGDIFGKLGRRIISERAVELKKKYKPDLTIANAENMTHGAGFSAKTIEEMMDAGIDFFTGGNHSLDNKNGMDVLKIPDVPVLRPYNMGERLPGSGFRLLTMQGSNVLIINLLGQLFMKSSVSNPFRAFDEILRLFEDIKLDTVIVDFHAETTSEKAAFAYHVNGRASLVFGTHTHVPTSDARIMSKGTGFISDIGFNGPLDSVIGIGPEGVIYNFIHGKGGKTSVVESGPKYLNALLVKINTETAACTHIEHISEIY